MTKGIYKIGSVRFNRKSLQYDLNKYLHEICSGAFWSRNVSVAYDARTKEIRLVLALKAEGSMSWTVCGSIDVRLPDFWDMAFRMLEMLYGNILNEWIPDGCLCVYREYRMVEEAHEYWN